MPSEDSVTLKSVARKLAERRGLDPDLFVRMINQESGFNPNAKNEKSGATGIAQVMSETAFNPGFGIKPLEDRNDPYESLRFAADYLKKMLDMFGNYELALAAYNAGPGNVQKAGGVPDFPETKNYVKSILSNTSETTRPSISSLDPAQGTEKIDIAAMIEDVFGDDTSKLPRPPGLSRTGRMSKMSPLSRMRVPGLSNIDRFSSPAGIASLLRKTPSKKRVI